MVNLGYWDPSADTETDSESGEESHRENASVPEQTSTDQEHKAETERDSRQKYKRLRMLGIPRR